MLVPLGALSVGAVLAGYVFHHSFISEGSGEFWKNSLVFTEHTLHAMHGVPDWVKWAPFAVMITGLLIAWYAYIRNPQFPAKFVEQFAVLHKFLYNKWYFDELYHLIFVRPAFWFGKLFWQRGDIGLIDKFGPNGAADLVVEGARGAKAMQSGYLYNYALVMLLGLVAAVTWVIAR